LDLVSQARVHPIFKLLHQCQLFKPILMLREEEVEVPQEVAVLPEVEVVLHVEEEDLVDP